MNYHSEYEQVMIETGKEARRSGLDKSECAISEYDPARSFWLAGWHDADMEAGVRITNFISRKINTQRKAA